MEVSAQAGDAEDMLRKALAHRPDVLVADVNMPPGRGDDGLVAALERGAVAPRSAFWCSRSSMRSGMPSN